ncbi:MAG: hypothetical protein E7394_01405 [Ruminococcaceae bacterium]|nr:hypothetical protein [Oscillospiraceae bacterium]
MKRTMTKLISVIMTVMLAVSLVPTVAGAARVGDITGYAQPTDIIATINGYQLESYNVNGLTYICVEDLRYYGFDVSFDMYSKSLSVYRNYGINTINPQISNPDFWAIGSNVSRKPILYTDIITYVDNNYVAGSNINGRTIINFNELSRFGEVNYDNSKREISLIMQDVEYNEVALFAHFFDEEMSKDYNADWTSRIRAKGDVIMITGNARRYMNYYDIQNYVNGENWYNDIQAAEEILNATREEGIPASSVYIELRNTDGTVIASYQAY